MTFDNFAWLLLVASTLTSLVTEALKKRFDENKKHYSANAIAGIVSLIISAAIGAFEYIFFNAPMTMQYIASVVALMAMSWLSAMLGYDKVMQTIAQLRK